ncbi:MAG: YARHG domain-containing protein [Lachnospiraceae bacterium]|nr:YARHG domain-containing protein [Lachnospiraceae bacterium]
MPPYPGTAAGPQGQPAPHLEPAGLKPQGGPVGNYYPGNPGGGKKKSGKKGLVIGLCILLILALFGIGGTAAYMMGAFDSFLYQSPDIGIEETEEDEEEKEEDEEEGEASGEDAGEADEAESETSGEEPTAPETSAIESETGMATEAPTDPAQNMPTQMPTEPVTGAADATAAMPTLAGQGGYPTQAGQGGYPTAAVPGAAQEYLIPDSSIRALTAADVAGMTKEQLRLARNEIYARHGRMFTSEDLQNYFNGKSWYRGTISAQSFTDSMLSQLEKDNIKVIQQAEEALQ